MDSWKLLRSAVKHEASDVHIQASAPPMIRDSFALTRPDKLFEICDSVDDALVQVRDVS